MSPAIGQSADVVRTVTDALSAHTLGNPNVHVLATPCLAGLCDEAAQAACGDVPTRHMRVDIRHLAATPLGDEVRISAEVVSADGVLVVCRIEGRDSNNRIVAGHVSRAVKA